MNKKLRTSIHGVGINDADYLVKSYGETCPVYNRWVQVLDRCYGIKKQANHPTYVGCTIDPEWLLFSNFKKWMESQDWHNKQIDKDILIPGNKHYSPDTCVFVDQLTNSFITEVKSDIGEWPTGVYFNKARKKFRASCRNPIDKTREHLGYFADPHEAYLAWRKRKHELACVLAEHQSDPRVAHALRTRYDGNN